MTLGYRRASRSAYRQWVAARRPSSRPAPASAKAPEQMDSSRAPARPAQGRDELRRRCAVHVGYAGNDDGRGGGQHIEAVRTVQAGAAEQWYGTRSLGAQPQVVPGHVELRPGQPEDLRGDPGLETRHPGVREHSHTAVDRRHGRMLAEDGVTATRPAVGTVQ